MAISEFERMKIIEEYEKEKKLEALARRCKVKPLHDANVYFDKIRKEHMELFKKHGYQGDAVYQIHGMIWEEIRKAVCEWFYLDRITDLKPEQYEKANNYAKTIIDGIFGIDSGPN